MTERLWSVSDPEGDVLEVCGRADLWTEAVPQHLRYVIGSLRVGGQDVFYVEPRTAASLRDALDRLLGVDERPPAPDPASLHMGRRAAAIGRQLDEHVQALARITQRAYELDAAAMPVSLKAGKLAELVHLLAVQEQRVAASLGDLLSELAGGQP